MLQTPGSCRRERAAEKSRPTLPAGMAEPPSFCAFELTPQVIGRRISVALGEDHGFARIEDKIVELVARGSEIYMRFENTRPTPAKLGIYLYVNGGGPDDTASHRFRVPLDAKVTVLHG